MFGWRWVGAGCCISRIWAALSFPPFTSLSLSLSTPLLPLSAGVWGTQGQALSCHLPPTLSPPLPVPALLHTYLTENSHLTVPHTGHSPLKPHAGTYNIRTLIYHRSSLTSWSLAKWVKKINKKLCHIHTTWTKVTYRTYGTVIYGIYRIPVTLTTPLPVEDMKRKEYSHLGEQLTQSNTSIIQYNESKVTAHPIQCQQYPAGRHSILHIKVFEAIHIWLF